MCKYSGTVNRFATIPSSKTASARDESTEPNPAAIRKNRDQNILLRNPTDVLNVPYMSADDFALLRCARAAPPSCARRGAGAGPPARPRPGRVPAASRPCPGGVPPASRNARTAPPRRGRRGGRPPLPCRAPRRPHSPPRPVLTPWPADRSTPPSTRGSARTASPSRRPSSTTSSSSSTSRRRGAARRASPPPGARAPRSLGRPGCARARSPLLTPRSAGAPRRPPRLSEDVC